jgi:ADP-heptose:LPS heptosyltransferase
LHWAASTPPPHSQLRRRLLRLVGRTLASGSPAKSHPQRVLLVRPDHVGDLLLTASAIALLRTSLPRAHLTYLVGPWSASAARQAPSVDEVRTLAFPGFTRQRKSHVVEPYAVLLREANRLRKEGYDLAVILRQDHWWGALLALCAGVPLRVGGATPETTPLLTHTYAASADEPWAAQSLGIARVALNAVGATAVEPDTVRPFAISDSAHAAADALWQQHHLGNAVIGVHPTAGAPLKSWPVQRWAQLADALVAEGSQLIFTGAPDDAALLNTIGERMRSCVPRLCGQSLEVSAAIYERCRLVISVDSGAGHLAAAVGTPTVRLYGPAHARVFGPWPTRNDQHVLSTKSLACAPCGFLEAPPCGAGATPACMLAIGVDDVLNAVRVQLNQS